MSADPYVYPGTTVLKNKFGITDQRKLDAIELEHVAQRMSEGIPQGKFDLKHLGLIHRHLFQDVYDWAGRVRTVEITKDGSQFQFRQFIETGMADVHRRLVQAKFLKGLDADQFAKHVGEILGDVNHVHPFREGNGRAQLQYLKQLTEQAGHSIDLGHLSADRWMEASRAAQVADYDRMARAIKHAIDQTPQVASQAYGLSR